MPLLCRNVVLGSPLKISAWRKIALGTWRTAGDPSVYAFVDLPVAPAMAYMEKARQASTAQGSPVKITLTHFAGRALAEVFKRHPSINVLPRFGRIYPRQTVDLFFQVASDAGGKDLTGMTIRQCDQKPLGVIAREMQERVDLIRQKGDPAFRKSKTLMGRLPGLLVGPLLTWTSWFLYTLNLWTPLLGNPRDPFGSAMITSVGMFGLPQGFAPLAWLYDIPLLVLVGEVTEKPLAIDGQVVVRSVLPITATLDHRYVDGWHVSQAMHAFREYLANPEKFEPELR